LAAWALVLGTAVYSAHGLGDRDHEHAHCDLCVHFSGSAGSPLPPAVVGKPVLAVRVVPVQPTILVPFRSPLDRYRPRGPPHSSLAAT
jgi:hypothetical protein